MNLSKFDYEVDTANPLILLGAEANRQLAKLCPVMVGKLAVIAERISSARLLLSVDKTALILDISNLARSLGELPQDVERAAAEAFLFMQIASSQLSKRYVDGTLDPAYHVGNSEALEHARAAVEAERAAATEQAEAV